MAAQTHAAAANLLKRVYFPGIRDQLNNETPGYSILRRVGKGAWSGSEVRMATRTGRNRSYRPTSSGNESQALPTPGRQTYDNFVVPCVLLHGTGGVSAFGAAATQSSEGAFEKMLKAEIDGLLGDAKKDLEIDFFGTPLGVLAKVAGDPGGGTTVTLDQAQSVLAWESYGNRYLSPNMPIQAMSENGAVVDNGTVDTVDSPNRNQFELDTAADFNGDDNYLIQRRGTAAAGAGANAQPSFAFAGLEYLIDDTTTMPAAGVAGGYEMDKLQGIDRSASTYAQGSVVDKAGVDLTRSDLHNLVYLQEERGAAYPDVFLTHRSVQLAIADLMVGDQRYQPQELPGGFKANSLLFNGGDSDIPILVARECPYDRLYSLNLDAIEMFTLTDFEMIETDGSVLRQDSGGGDVWNFSFRMFGNMGSRQPNALGKMVRIGGGDEGFGVAAARLYDF